MSGVQYGACGAAASERRGVVALRGGGVESVGTRDGETERRRGGETERQRDRETERQRGREAERQRDRETERQRLGRKKIFFENNFDFSEIRVIFVRS